MGFQAKVLQVRLKYLVYLLILSFALANGYDWVGYRLNEQAVEAMSWVMAGQVIAIDPGHGGYDPGKIGVGGSKEKDINLAVAQKLAHIIQGSGAITVLTRDRDIDLVTQGEGTKKKRDLDKRLEIVADATIFIGIQANALGSRWTGAQTFYNEKNVESKNLAIAIQAEIKRQLKNTNREALKMNDSTSYMLRNLKHIPSVIVEVGFLSNREEERLLNDPNYQKQMAMAIYSGLVKYLGE